ncbi:DUF411 domain-containing protein [Marinobacter nanhaiticus D15-8W]|uniref:DUF411 domain-containing protein n=1 Tax=Marinobacter nanhaiticus D15-8W TaxID=626887 RepID=N6WWH5_9GAMM|nr:DUF411 domain-containing protein [Marinobacter nanhaiticus]ENO15407.1 DUF411 domain-containing protein [Marinobacter nanhaiticus D15-8W]BES73745.1 DUF411 domain-containing protein [Marinobacter nanhaiticus D15-8W]
MSKAKQFLRASLLAAASLVATPALVHAAEAITVYKSPTCGCCTDWVRHLEENGFDVTVHDTANINEIKVDAGLTRELASCHTAFVGDYVIEGHVPAQDIHRLIAEAPQAQGLAVPGMPIGSPGMEMGDRKDPYTVLLFNEAGQSRPYANYPQ